MQTLKELDLCEQTPTGLEAINVPAWRSWHEDPDWIGELADCLHFVELLRYKFHKTGHINVLECRTYKTWLKHCARKYPNSRLVALLDSRVTLGAAAKGRSSSFCFITCFAGCIRLRLCVRGGFIPRRFTCWKWKESKWWAIKKSASAGSIQGDTWLVNSS